MIHLVIGSIPLGGTIELFLTSDWFLTICLTPNNNKTVFNVLLNIIINN